MPITARTHRIAALILVLALSLPLTARADEASHLAKAKEMMTLLQAQHMVDNISANILKQVSDAADKLAGPSPSPDKQAKLDDFKKQAAQVIDTQVGWKALQAGFADASTRRTSPRSSSTPSSHSTKRRPESPCSPTCPPSTLRSGSLETAR